MCLLGTFAPYMTVHESSVVKIDPTIPFEVAALVGCGVPTGFGSATHVADTQPGDTVVVIGIGGVGTSAVQGAAISGASKVIAIDPVPFKRQMAEKLGATHTFPSMEAALEAIGDITWGKMANTTILELL